MKLKELKHTINATVSQSFWQSKLLKKFFFHFDQDSNKLNVKLK